MGLASIRGGTARTRKTRSACGPRRAAPGRTADGSTGTSGTLHTAQRGVTGSGGRPTSATTCSICSSSAWLRISTALMARRAASPGPGENQPPFGAGDPHHDDIWRIDEVRRVVAHQPQPAGQPPQHRIKHERRRDAVLAGHPPPAAGPGKPRYRPPRGFNSLRIRLTASTRQLASSPISLRSTRSPIRSSSLRDAPAPLAQASGGSNGRSHLIAQRRDGFSTLRLRASAPDLPSTPIHTTRGRRVSKAPRPNAVRLNGPCPAPPLQAPVESRRCYRVARRPGT